MCTLESFLSTIFDRMMMIVAATVASASAERGRISSMKKCGVKFMNQVKHSFLPYIYASACSSLSHFCVLFIEREQASESFFRNMINERVFRNFPLVHCMFSLFFVRRVSCSLSISFIHFSTSSSSSPPPPPSLPSFDIRGSLYIFIYHGGGEHSYETTFYTHMCCNV
jgi:hypothetical protein